MFTLPEQITGGYSDNESSREFKNSTEANAFFQILKKRFLDISNWQTYAGEKKAEFHLCDARGLVKDSTPAVGDYIKIKVPGIHNVTGDAFDWVQIELFEEITEISREGAYLRVRPSVDPANHDEVVAHFFTKAATSNFIIERHDDTVFAKVFGRNEIPNTDNLNILEKARNALVAVGGMLGGSKFQWKSMTDGLLED